MTGYMENFTHTLSWSGGAHAYQSVEIQKESALEEAEKPEPELKCRVTTITKLTAGLEVTEAGYKVFKDVDSNDQRAAAASHSIVRLPQL